MSDSRESSRPSSPELNIQTQNSDTTDQLQPNPAPRTSLPVRFSNPDVLNSERPLLEITSDEQFFNTLTNNEQTLINVNETLRGVDQTLLSIDNSIEENLLNQNILLPTPNSSNQIMNSVTLETGQTSGVTGSVQQSVVLNSEGTPNIDTQAISNQQVIEENPDQSGVRYSYGPRGETIGLEAALKLLPGSFSGDKQEELEIFLEKCEFALACAHDHVQSRLLQGIQVRLTGKARQAVKFKEIKTWTELKDGLKLALEPQRTTTYLFSELYSTRQKIGEDVTNYANRIEKLQTLIIEQETSGHSWEIAQALGTSIKKQTIQVFVEGLGPLKDFIKARNPLTLDKAIQAAREEERVRNSQEATKKLYGSPHQSMKKPTCFYCNKVGHMAKDCRSKPATANQRPSSTTAPVRSIECFYCKKPGHMLKDCRKRNYVNSKKEGNQQENSQQPAASGGRPVSELKNTGSDKSSTSKQN